MLPCSLVRNDFFSRDVPYKILILAEGYLRILFNVGRSVETEAAKTPEPLTRIGAIGMSEEQIITEETQDQEEVASGILEITPKGYGFLRQERNKFRATPGDVFVGKDFIGGERLRQGLFIEAKIGSPTRRKGGPRMEEILRINGRPHEDYMDVTPFSDLLVIDPQPHVKLETNGGPLEMRILDLICPVGRGQRGLIVAPPRSGKTVLLQQIAASISLNAPDAHLIVLLIDERPEELTDFKRKTKGEVVASTNDQDVASHVRAAEFTIERAKRMVEFGDDVIILLDSLTRLGRRITAPSKAAAAP